ncbi:hypothetical protein [Streptomyces peucetius]|uniref:hypothetical protein n=1 Tax=Streptomyces peucetius TaxID=1950 RepID=UPI00299F82F1|nr:hypothetical protein [Streptomyces peucetius]
MAVTTDRTATSTLERLTFDVAWLSCTAQADRGTATASGAASPSPEPPPSPSPPGRATVDCRGETRSGQDITVNGTVTEERSGRCVHGDLTARVEKKIVFRATMLGDCTTAPSSTSAPGGTPAVPGPPRPTVTVTVTETVTSVPAK